MLRIFSVLLLLFVGIESVPAQDLSYGTRDARPAPEWLYRSTIYEIWLDAFSKEGNLRGAISHLLHVADLGARIVYLGPIAKPSANPQASPYSIADFNEIDPGICSRQEKRGFSSIRAGLCRSRRI
jgi:cyclomaltodextrinase